MGWGILTMAMEQSLLDGRASVLKTTPPITAATASTYFRSDTGIFAVRELSLRELVLTFVCCLLYERQAI